MSYFFGRYTLTAGTDTLIQGLPQNGVGAIVVSNESPYSITASLQSAGVDKNIGAWVADMLVVPQTQAFSGNLLLHPTAQITQTNAPSSQVEINIYGVGERLPATYPMALPRQSTTANQAGVQGELQFVTAQANMNNNTQAIPPNPFPAGQTPYLVGFELRGSSASAKAKGAMTVTGFNTTVDVNNTGLTYEIEVYTGGPMLDVEQWFHTPLQGIEGAHITFTVPAVSDAVLSLNIYYYLI